MPNIKSCSIDWLKMYLYSLKAQHESLGFEGHIRYWASKQSILAQGKLLAFIIVGRTTQKEPHAPLPSIPAHPTLPSVLGFQGIAGLQKKMSQKRNLNFKRRLIWSSPS